jgi:cytochrome P450
MTTTDAPVIDLLSPSSFVGGQPHAQFRWLREHDPVHFHPEPDGRGFWALTRYDDVRNVGRDPKTFSSYAGGVMIPDADEMSLMGPRLMMLFMDPPEHTRHRHLVQRGFTPKGAAAWQERVDQLAVEIVDAVIEQGACDLVKDLAGEMPSLVIADVMGIPRSDARHLYELTEIMHSAPGTVADDVRISSSIEMLSYAGSVFADKRVNPADDLATVLVESELDGDRLTDADLAWFFLLLINAGGDTTRNLVGGGMHALFDHPDERARLQPNDPQQLDAAMEELLRWVSPVVHMRRTALRDTTVGDTPIAEGDKVVLYYGAANRDPAHFAEPERLDVARTPNEHVAFGGGGPHFCLGAPLARIEIRAILREILTRLPDIEPAGETTWLESNFISGPQRLPVRFTPGRRVLE